MLRRWAPLLAGALSLGLMGLAPRPAPKGPPNIIVILADDLGTPDISAYGYRSAISTPNIDQLARRGVRFTRGYVSASVCSPSRAGLLSGQYQQRHGFEYLTPENDTDRGSHGLAPDQRLLPEPLKKAGYHTVAIGKWHLGNSPDRLPTARGFDEFYGFLGGETAYIDSRTPGATSVSVPYVGERSFTRKVASQVVGRWRAGSPEKTLINNDDRYLTDEFTDEAVRAITDRPKDRPFFMYLAYNAPHAPMQATAKYMARFPNEKDPVRRTYAAMISALDDGVGRVLGELDRQGVRDNTIVVFLADNGAATYLGISDCETLAGGKLSAYEGGARVPYIVSWPARWPKGQVDTRNVSSLDIYATAISAAGIPSDKPLDGVDLTPLMQPDRRREVVHDALFWRIGPEYAALSGDWKLFSNTRPGNWPWLFDLASDPRETQSVLFRRRDIVGSLKGKYDAWARQMKPSSWAPKETLQVMECGRVVFHDQ